MLERVRTYIEGEKLLQPYAKVIVGLSGGTDSMALIDILTRLGYHCIAAHCNFHLRGTESDRDADFVKGWCERHAIPLLSIDFDTCRHAREQRISIEMAARELRYDWFEKIRQEQGAEAIAVAHHRGRLGGDGAVEPCSRYRHQGVDRYPSQERAGCPPSASRLPHRYRGLHGQEVNPARDR